MSQKLKLVLGAAGFAALIILAVIGYNILSGKIQPEDGIRIEQEQGDVSGADDIREKAPDFTMVDWDGNDIKLSELIAKGKPVVLNFWASWCPPCKGEMPEFEKVYSELGQDVQFVMVDLVDGMQETKATGEKYIRDQGYTFPVFFDAKGEGASEYGIRSIPTTIFIDKDGNSIAEVLGAIDEATLRRGIEGIR